LQQASPAVWIGLAVAALSWPIFLGVLVGAIPSVRPFFRGDRSRWFSFWWVTVAALWTVAAIVVLLMHRGGVTLDVVGAALPGRGARVAGVTVVLLLVATALAVSKSVVGPGPTEHGQMFLPHTRGERLFMILVIAPSAALCEEVVYRGFLLRLLAPAIGLWPANVVQAFLFGFHHGGVKQGWVALVSRAAIGFAFGLLAIRLGTLTLVIALHYLVDAALAVRPSRSVIVARAA
jgi:membrane protease YdiL (CAAX protease family)